MTNMDAYTILYQAKETMIEEEGLHRILNQKDSMDLKQIVDDEEAIRALALKGIEQGINRIKREFPPNVSKRMNKYYRINKEVLVSTFYPRIHEEVHNYCKKSNL